MKLFPKTSLSRSKSQSIFQNSCEVIPGGVNSPVRSFPGLNETPLVAFSGHGDKVVDADGNTYIDFCGSWGALIHGHAHPKIVEAAQKRVALGSSFGITTEIEALLAKKIVSLMPQMEKVRFVSSGTEATMSAIRLARGFTKRDRIVKFSGNYHGHSDAFLVQAGSGVTNLVASSSSGVPHDFIKHTLCLPHNETHALKVLDSKVAAVIIEPIAANMGLVLPEKGFLEELRALTKKVGALLIFDEVITGFRIALGGATEKYGIEPDLITLGKIMGGGFPAAAFGGKKEIMDHLAPLGAVYQAGTLSGNPVAMEAGFQSVSLCEEPFFYQTLEEKTALITRPIKEMIEKENLNICLQEMGSLFTIFFGRKKVRNFEEAKRCDLNLFNRFFKFLFHKGIYVAPSQFETNFVSMAHTYESLLYTRESILEFFTQLGFK